MKAQANKTQDNKSQSVANEVSQKQKQRESVFQMEDNRPEAIAQRRLQEGINNSPRAQQLKAIRNMASNSPRHQHALQLQAKMQAHTMQKFTQFMKPEKEEKEEEPLQGKFETAQRVASGDDEEETLQGKFKSGSQNVKSQTSGTIQKQSETPAKNNTGLPDNLKTGIENLSGHSMDDVKVHYNSDKPAQLNADAYAQGTDIHLASGQEKHLPHEAWHVVQQKQGRVKPTMQMKGKVSVNDDAGLEKEADVMGSKALQMEKTSQGPGARQLKAVHSPIGFSTVQRVFAMTNEATTIAPITQGNLLKWLKKTASPGVKTLLESPNVNFTIRFDDTIGSDGSTNIDLQYTDKNSAAGNINLFAGASVAVISGLEYPLQNFQIQITTSVKTGGRLQGTPPAAAAAATTWQGILTHEIEAHTGLAQKTLETLTKMNTARKAALPSLKKKITNSMEARTDDAEHKGLASGNATLAKAQENTILKAATHNEKVDILVDIVTDRVKHIGWFITKDAEKKLALRDAKSFLVKTADKIGDLVAADNTRINALKGWIDGEMP